MRMGEGDFQNVDSRRDDYSAQLSIYINLSLVFYKKG